MPRISGRHNGSRSAPEAVPDSGRSLKGNIALALVFCICVTVACSVAPDSVVVEDVIRRHFEARQYRVVELRIDRVISIPLSEKTYMGTPGYTVEVQSITLEAAADNLPGFPKGEKRTFSGATVMIREKSGERGVWTLSRISGIPLL